jgi:hypothetical protein
MLLIEREHDGLCSVVCGFGDVTKNSRCKGITACRSRHAACALASALSAAAAADATSPHSPLRAASLPHLVDVSMVDWGGQQLSQMLTVSSSTVKHRVGRLVNGVGLI